MNIPDDLREQMRAFHSQLAVMYHEQQRHIALRYLASLEQEPPPMQKAVKRLRPLIVRGRRFISRQFHALAQVIDPDPAPSTEDGEGEEQVIELRMG